MSVSIGDNIRALRIKAGMTQSRLAERLGVTDQAVSKWETGAASPDLSLIVPLTRLFGVTADALLGIDRPAEEARRQALEAQWEETMMTGDTAVRLEAAQKLADAQPDDPARRLQLAGRGGDVRRPRRGRRCGTPAPLRAGGAGVRSHSCRRGPRCAGDGRAAGGGALRRGPDAVRARTLRRSQSIRGRVPTG